MAGEQVWDTTASDSTSEELAYFSGLKFAVPTATSQIRALPLQHMLDWLLNPNGPLMEGEERNVPSTSALSGICTRFCTDLEAHLLLNP